MSDNRLLIVDDNVQLGCFVARAAATLGFKTIATHDPSEFITTYLDFQPDIILLDLQMPGVDGIELLRLLGQYKSQATIMLFSGFDSAVIDTARRLGEELHLHLAESLQKPVTLETLRAKLSKYLDAPVAHVPPPQQVWSLTADDLIQALEHGDLVTYYQPKVCLETAKVSGVEVLARWHHAHHGWLVPDAFIDLAERSELIVPLTTTVLQRALQDYGLWKQQDFTLAVNLSPRLLTDLTLPDRICELLRRYNIPPSQLILEITENSAMAEPAKSMDILSRIRLKGIQLSIDDFGTGFSSLVQLYRLPYTEVKIDKSFVMDAKKNTEAASIVQAAINLGHSMGMTVTAEGIETQDVYDWLVTLGCDHGQGYYISRPLDAYNLLQWLHQDHQA